jgi:uncharacterized RDD family membrane protein YckC
MEQWYYTDWWNKQYGPVEDSVLRQANSSGTIHAGTLVWKPGLPQWVTFLTVAPEIFEKDAQGNTPELGVCAHSGRVCPREDMIPYGNALIGVESRQDFVQSLMESGRVINTNLAEKSGKYVGFWWRLLGVFLDEMIKYTVMAILAISLIMIGGFSFAMFETNDRGAEIGDKRTFLDEVAYNATGNSPGDVLSGLLLFGLMIVIYGSGAFYEIWMVGKYQGTLGKMAIGAKVVLPDDGRVSYKRSLARWAAKVPFFLEGLKIIPYLSFVVMLGMAAGSFKANHTAMIIASFFLAFVVPLMITAIFSSAFWMAGRDGQKRALHDRIASTRVVFKGK